MPGTPRAVGRNDKIHTLSPRTDELTQCARPSPRRRPANRAEPELFHHSIHELSITMLADQNPGITAAVGKRHHQLLSMPERDNHRAALPV